MAKEPKKEKKEGELTSLENKWGKEGLSFGWTGVPNILIERQQALGLTPIEVNILLILMKYWREAGNHPYPSKRTIGEMVGKEESTIRRCMASLERKGLIQRNAHFLSLGGQSSNKYVMDGLVSKLEEEAKGLKKLRESRKTEDASIRRGAPIPMK